MGPPLMSVIPHCWFQPISIGHRCLPGPGRAVSGFSDAEEGLAASNVVRLAQKVRVVLEIAKSSLNLGRIRLVLKFSIKYCGKALEKRRAGWKCIL